MANVTKTVSHQEAVAQIQARRADLKKKQQELANLRSKRLTRNLIFTILIVMALGIGFTIIGHYYLAMLVAVGLLPGFVAYTTDTRKGRLASKTVMALNIAGLMPPVAGVLLSGTPDQAALSAVENPTTWLLVYGFSAIGWGLVYLLPHIASLFLEIRADVVVRKLETRQKELLEEWGERITGQSTQSTSVTMKKK
jgi:hypothetical protein